MNIKTVRNKNLQRGVVHLLTLLFASLLLFAGFIVFWPKQGPTTVGNVGRSEVLSRHESYGRGSAAPGRVTVIEDGTVVRLEAGRRGGSDDLPPGVRVRTRQEEQGRIGVYQGASKLKLQKENGKVSKKLENEDGEEGELPDGEEGEVFRIVGEEGETDVLVSTEEASLAVSSNGVRARTNFPLSINLDTNELIVTTPAGTKAVAVLPDQAVQNMIVNGVLTSVDSEEEEENDTTATDSADLEDEEEEEIELVVSDDGELVYEIEGSTQEAFLGLFSITIEKEAVVSAETGELREVRKTLFNRLLDALSLRG